MGLVVDEYGFPKKSEFFEGNVSEPKTLEKILEQLKSEKTKTIIIDAGIATEENLKMIKEKGFDYLCVSRSKPKEDDKNNDFILIKETEDNKIEARLVKKDNEQVLLCKSKSKELKESAMLELFRKKFEEGLESIKESLKKKTGVKKYEKVMERLGRLKQITHGVYQFYDIEVIKDEKGNVKEINYKYSKEEEAKEKYSGQYYIKTSRMDLKEKEIWELYITLNGIEDSFRSMKEDLGMRPVFHRKNTRIEAHLFITVLAYHILNAIRYELRKKDIFLSWNRIRKHFSTMVLSTVSMVTKDNKTIYIRNTSKPNDFQKEIFDKLNLNGKIINKKITIVE